MDDLLAQAAQRFFSQTCQPGLLQAAEDGAPPLAAWQACQDAGFADALLPEDAGGAGLILPQILPLLHEAGRHLFPFPLADTLLARAWLHHQGQTVPDGPIALAPHGLRSDAEGIHGDDLPWARSSAHILGWLDGQACLLAVNQARERRDSVHGSLDASLRWHRSAVQPLPGAATAPELALLAALGYTGLIAGALEQVLALTLDYASTRRQFGKPIGRFQAVQQSISIMAEQTCAARMASELAFSSASWAPAPMLAALGKARSSQAAWQVSTRAHAVHGAIGITQEFALQRYSRRLQAWRRAAGSETFWQARIGADALADSRTALDYLLDRLQPA